MGFTAIKAGQIDCYWNAITKTEERMEYATFTDDYIQYLYEYEDDGEWYTSHLLDEDYRTESEAIAATVAWLKEGCDE